MSHPSTVSVWTPIAVSGAFLIVLAALVWTVFA